MNKKYFILIATLFLAVAIGFSQDTTNSPVSNNLKNNQGANSGVSHDTGIVNPNPVPATPRASVNSNTGTITPATTSGTLNSTVNPSTQIVIPIGKNKRKSNSRNIPESGIISPVKK